MAVRLSSATGRPSGHDPTKRPLRFELRLLDFDAMVGGIPKGDPKAAPNATSTNSAEGGEGCTAGRPELAGSPAQISSASNGGSGDGEAATFAAVLAAAAAKP